MSGRPTSSTTSRGRCVADRLEPAAPGRGLQDPEALAVEVEVDEVGDVGLVVDDDDRPLVHASPFHSCQRAMMPVVRMRASDAVGGQVERLARTTLAEPAGARLHRARLGLAVDADEAERSR